MFKGPNFLFLITIIFVYKLLFFNELCAATAGSENADGTPDFLVITVKSVEDSKTTNVNPPTFEFQIDEVISGDKKFLKTNTSFQGVWLPAPHDINSTAEGAKSQIEAWEKTPVKGPSINDKLVVMGKLSSDGIFLVNSNLRLPYSTEVVTELRKALNIKPELKTIW